MDRARGDGARGARVVVGGADRDHFLPVAVGGLEDGAGDVGPEPDGAGAGAVIGPVGGVRAQHVEDSQKQRWPSSTTRAATEGSTKRATGRGWMQRPGR